MALELLTEVNSKIALDKPSSMYQGMIVESRLAAKDGGPSLLHRQAPQLPQGGRHFCTSLSS